MNAQPPRWHGQSLWQLLLLTPDWPAEFARVRQAWREASERPGRLHVVCLAAHAPLPAHLGDVDLRTQAVGLLPGIHRLLFEQGAVQLTLAVGPQETLLREQELEIDEVALGADEPQPSASAWARALARCCRPGTHLRAPRASDALRSALTSAGFDVAASTPDLRAVFAPRWQARKRWLRPARWDLQTRCTILGAGLAGAACAASLARRGWQVTVLDREGPAAGASGLPVGLMAPHVSPDDGVISRLSRAGVRATLNEARQRLTEGLDWAANGVLQRRLDDEGPQLPAHWPEAGQPWSCEADEVDFLPQALRAQSLWHASGAWIRPERLIASWLSDKGISQALGQQACDLQQTEEGLWQVRDAQGQLLAESELLILASGPHTQALVAPWLPPGARLQPVRGQVSWGLHTPGDVLPPVPVNGHGSLVSWPTPQGQAWLLGATFDRDNDKRQLRTEDHMTNLRKLERLLPDTAASLAPRFSQGQVQGWAGVRCSWRDHLPLVGPLSPQLPGLWLCTAFGSRGLSYSALCAELIAAWLHGEPLPVEPKLAQLVRASRLLGKA